MGGELEAPLFNSFWMLTLSRQDGHDRSDHLTVQTFPFGRHHQYFAFVAALTAAITGGAWASGMLPTEAYDLTLGVFPMMFFASTVSRLAYGESELDDAAMSLAKSYWVNGKLLFVAATLAGIVHILLFGVWTATLLRYCGTAAAIWLLPVMIVFFRSRRSVSPEAD